MARADQRPSEFGGEPGMVARFEHELTPAEEARLMRATDELDESDTVEGALARERAREGRT
jgi:hypothetical protein